MMGRERGDPDRPYSPTLNFPPFSLLPLFPLSLPPGPEGIIFSYSPLLYNQYQILFLF